MNLLAGRAEIFATGAREEHLERRASRGGTVRHSLKPDVVASIAHIRTRSDAFEHRRRPLKMRIVLPSPHTTPPCAASLLQNLILVWSLRPLRLSRCRAG